MTEKGSPARRVALFGGSFNPPHVCHALAAVWALQTQPIDEVWWVPTFSHAFGKRLLPFDDRVAMVTAAIASFDCSMRVSRIEEELGGVSRTIDTVRALQEQFRGYAFSLLIGADIQDQISSWKESEALLKLVNVYVIGREGYQDPSTYDLRLPDISSTALRSAIGEGNSSFYRPRMAREVVQMIERNQWYTSK